MSSIFPTYEAKYKALLERNPDAEGQFIYCVLSTSICCRPTCSSRLPLKKNIMFCDNLGYALKEGFRPCRRCKPEIAMGWNKPREMVESACIKIMNRARCKNKIQIEEIAFELGVSKWHFCRTFKNYTGITPKRFYNECVRGSNTLDLNLIPIIQTKKNLEKQRLFKSLMTDILSIKDNEGQELIEDTLNTKDHDGQELTEDILSLPDIPHNDINGDIRQRPIFLTGKLYEMASENMELNMYLNNDLEYNPVEINTSQYGFFPQEWI